MIVVDTCIWIEFFKGNDPIASELEKLLENGEVLACELVFAELMQGAKNKREKQIISSYWRNLPKFSLDGVPYRAGTDSANEKWYAKGVGLIDVMILLYSRESAAQLWTIDKKLFSICKTDDKY